MEDFYLAIAKTGPSAKETRRASLVQTVMDILATEGIDELTLERVGKRAGMARSHVVYYFKNRDALIRAAIDCAALSAQTIIQRRLEKEPSPEKKLPVYIEANFLWIENYPQHASVYTLMFYLATFHKSYRDLHTKIREIGCQRIRAMLMEMPSYRGRKDRATTTAQDIQALMTGHLVDVSCTRNKKKLRERMGQTQSAVKRILAQET